VVVGMSPDNPVSRLFEKIYGASRLSVDVEAGDVK